MCCLINLLKEFLIYIGIYWEKSVLSFILIISSLVFNPIYTNFELHKHHLFASGIIIIVGIIITIYYFSYETDKLWKIKTDTIFSILFFFFDSFSYCIYNNLSNIEFISPFFIIGMKGIITLFIFILLNFFYFQIEDLKNIYIKSFENWKYIKNICNYELAAYILANILFLILMDIFKTLIIIKLSPCHFFICHYIILVIQNVRYFSSSKDTLQLIIEIIFQLLYIISSLIFCEIIVLKFCHLDVDIIEEKRRRISIQNYDNDFLSDEQDI